LLRRKPFPFDLQKIIQFTPATMTQTTQLTAIVTGAARGIGLATTQLFLSKGYRVAMVDRDTAELHSVAAGLQNVLAAIQDTTFERWQTVMRTNLDGVFLCSQAALPPLRESRGCIVNIGSISGLRASTLRVAYGTSKAAVIHLTKQQAAELGEWGIRVNCVAPGPVKTKLAAAVHTPAIVSAYHDAIPLNRYGSEVEIARVIVFLASTDASYLTGQVIAVDGGFDATGVGLPALRIADSINDPPSPLPAA